MEGGFYTNYKPQNIKRVNELRLDPVELINDVTECWKNQHAINLDSISSQVEKQIRNEEEKRRILQKYLYEEGKPHEHQFIRHRTYELVKHLFMEHDSLNKQIPNDIWNATRFNPIAFDGAITEAIVATYVEKSAILQDLKFNIKAMGSFNVVLTGNIVNTKKIMKPCVLRIYKSNQYVNSITAFQEAKVGNFNIFNAFRDNNYIVKPLFGTTDINSFDPTHSRKIYNIYWYILPVLEEVEDQCAIRLYGGTQYAVMPKEVAIRYFNCMKNVAITAHNNDYIYLDWKWSNCMVNSSNKEI